MADYTQLATQAVDFIRTQVTPAAIGWGVEKALEKGSEQARRLWRFLKSKLTSPAAAGAIQEADQQPDKPLKWEALRLQILQALQADEAFRKELLGLLPPGSTTQTINSKGDANVNVQISGSSNKLDIGPR
jgi:hypothetical protein